MLKKIIYLCRFLLKVKFNKNIHSNSIVLLQKNVKLIVEDGGQIVFGEKVIIKENTTIYAKENAKIIIGNNTSTGHNAEISANNYIKIGDDVIMGAYCYITDSNHGYKDKNLPIRKQPMQTGKTIIGNNVWLGRSTMILKDSTIGNNSVVSAGSIVTKEFEDSIIVAGVPAKNIKRIYE